MRSQDLQPGNQLQFPSGQGVTIDERADDGWNTSMGFVTDVTLDMFFFTDRVRTVEPAPEEQPLIRPAPLARITIADGTVATLNALIDRINALEAIVYPDTP